MDSKLASFLRETGSTCAPGQFKGEDVVTERNKTAPLSYYHKERELAVRIVCHSMKEVKRYSKEIIISYIEEFEEREKISFDVWQKTAVFEAINNNLFILTGGPGTGKTCVLKCIFFVLKKIYKRNNIAFTAPTGKAARRITESTGEPAQTLHKKLGIVSEQSKPEQILEDVLIVDEVSMLDIDIALKLFQGLTAKTKLILVGDVDQLPSVGPGAVLRDLIDADVPSVKLEKTFRQASESGLFANIIEIRKGLPNGFIERDDFGVLKSNGNTSLLVETFLKEVKEYGLENVCMLTPFRKKGETCAIKMNAELQEKINPRGKTPFLETEISEENFKYKVRFQEGDPVMQLENREEVANGDVGKIISVKRNRVEVQFIDCKVVYDKDELYQLALAYAMSVHKSQGSEYKSVITTALSSEKKMLSRNTIYTAITRAKKKCTVIIDDAEIVTEVCKKETGYDRYTFLADEIKTAKKQYTAYQKLATF